ncbi:hypothetical protein [Nocardia sp. NPDC004260]
MKVVSSKRKTLHSRGIERRELSPVTGRAVREFAREISATLDATIADPAIAPGTLTDPTLIEQIDTRVMETPALHAMRLPATPEGPVIVSQLPSVDNEFGPTQPNPVHGRVPFTAHYDGADRWLKPVNSWLPQRPRRAEESEENGYRQRTVIPFRCVGHHNGQASYRLAGYGTERSRNL